MRISDWSSDVCSSDLGLQRIRPGLGRAHFEHGVQPLADFLVVVEGAAMEWSLPAGLLARRLVELELENAGEEVARVGRVAGDVEFGARIEMLLGARDRRAVGRGTGGERGVRSRGISGGAG